MKKLVSFLLAVAMICTMLTSCGGSNAADAGKNQDAATENTATAENPIVIKISHQNASTHPIQEGLLEFKRILEEKSGNTITCDIYDSAVLGNDTSNVQQVIANSLDAAMIMGAVIWQGYDDRASVEEVPFLFSDYESAWAAYDGEFGDYIAKEIIEPQGGHVVGFWDNGFRHFTNNTRSVSVPADMHGIKFRTAESEIRLQMFDCLDSAAIVMAFSELYSAMQQGTVDGQENPLSNIVSSCFYEVQKYLSLSGHIYNTSVFVFSDKFWNSLTAEQQRMITEASDEAKLYARKLNIEKEEEYKEICEENGMEINEVDKDAFIEAVQPVWNTFKEKHGSELLDLAAKYNN